MTAYQAAMGVSQLSRIERTIERKREIADLYNKHLSGIDWLRLPSEKDWARHVYWMYAVVVDRKAPVSRDGLAEWLREAGIDTRTFFCPIGQQPFLQREGLRETACPVADTLWESGLYLPSSVGLDDGTIERIAMAIRSITE
jgi:perosamine synthetase